MRDRVYLALVHHPTVDREGRRIATAVTTLDLHDLSRIARTYGLGGVYATTPLETQRQLAGRLIGHWVAGHGGRVNPSRREALEALLLADDLAGVERDLSAQWGRAPVLVATSAQSGPGRVDFAEARRRFAGIEGPALLVFGTGWGLAPEVMEACDWALEPIRGLGPYNHLSVRAAAAIIVDRLFGDRLAGPDPTGSALERRPLCGGG